MNTNREARRIFINECLTSGTRSFHEISEMVRFLETTDYEIHDASEIEQHEETKMFNFKPFTESDWMTYSGCEGEPETCEATVKLDGEDYIVIVVLDDLGINLDYVKADDEFGDWLHDFYFDVEEGGKERARSIFHMLNIADATIEGLQAIGFHYNDLTENARS